MTKSLDQPHIPDCPKSFIKYKNECYYHSFQKGDYNKSEILCAERASRVVTIKDRATFEFIRMWSKENKFGNFYLGVNYTTGDSLHPVQYSDGTPYNKSIDYAFDDNFDKFGEKECNYMKSSIKYKPRDTECSVEMAPICQWNSKIYPIIYFNLHDLSFRTYMPQ